MRLPRKKPAFPAPAPGEGTISPGESMAYMGDLLENMRRIAQTQGLGVLAHLLELARTEARLVARDQPSGRDQTIQQGPIRQQRAVGG